MVDRIFRACYDLAKMNVNLWTYKIRGKVYRISTEGTVARIKALKITNFHSEIIEWVTNVTVLIAGLTG